MKKFHILLLLSIIVAISILISFLGALTTYDTVRSAKDKPGKFIHLIAKLDKTRPVEYDPVKDPNYLKFTVIDSLGDAVTVIYHNAKPDNLEVSERLVLKGSMKKNFFDCKEIMMKCPSKYKDEINTSPAQIPAVTIARSPE